MMSSDQAKSIVYEDLRTLLFVVAWDVAIVAHAEVDQDGKKQTEICFRQDSGGLLQEVMWLFFNG